MARRNLVAGLVALLVSAGIASATVVYIASEQIAVATTAIGFTAAKITPAGLPQAQTAACRLETAEIRWSIDPNTTPTTTVGTLLEPGETFVVSGHDVLTYFKAIRTGASSGQLDCTYTAP